MNKARRNRRRNRPPPAPAAKPEAAPATELQDVDIKAVEAEIMNRLTPKNRANVERVVIAGMKAGLHGGENSIIAGIVHSKDPLRDCAVGAVNLTMMLRKQSRDTMPMDAAVPGAIILMLHALDFADRVGVLEVDRDQITKATKIIVNQLFNVSGITPQRFNAIGQKVAAISQDPAQMDQLARRSGVVKDPRASMRTELPPGLINGGGNVQ